MDSKPPKPAERREPLPVVTAKRARCPECRSVAIYCRKSCGDQGDGSTMAYYGCRDCQEHFVLILE